MTILLYLVLGSLIYLRGSTEIFHLHLSSVLHLPIISLNSLNDSSFVFHNSSIHFQRFLLESATTSSPIINSITSSFTLSHIEVHLHSFLTNLFHSTGTATLNNFILLSDSHVPCQSLFCTSSQYPTIQLSIDLVNSSFHHHAVLLDTTTYISSGNTVHQTLLDCLFHNISISSYTPQHSKQQTSDPCYVADCTVRNSVIQHCEDTVQGVFIHLLLHLHKLHFCSLHPSFYSTSSTSTHCISFEWSMQCIQSIQILKDIF